MTDDANQPKREQPSLFSLLSDMLAEHDHVKRSEHQSNLLADQLTALCNEFLDAGTKREHKNTLGQVILALLKVTSSTLAQNNPDNLRELLTQLRAATKELEYMTLEAHQSLHCLQHHARDTHKPAGAKP